MIFLMWSSPFGRCRLDDRSRRNSSFGSGGPRASFRGLAAGGITRSHAVHQSPSGRADRVVGVAGRAPRRRGGRRRRRPLRGVGPGRGPPPVVGAAPRRPRRSPATGWVEGWAQWDSGWYYRIARDGYSYVEGQQSTVVFFPAYPLLMRVTGGAGGRAPTWPASWSPLAAGVASAALFFAWVRDRLTPGGGLGRAAAVRPVPVRLLPVRGRLRRRRVHPGRHRRLRPARARPPVAGRAWWGRWPPPPGPWAWSWWSAWPCGRWERRREAAGDGRRRPAAAGGRRRRAPRRAGGLAAFSPLPVVPVRRPAGLPHRPGGVGPAGGAATRGSRSSSSRTSPTSAAPCRG